MYFLMVAEQNFVCSVIEWCTYFIFQSLLPSLYQSYVCTQVASIFVRVFLKLTLPFLELFTVWSPEGGLEYELGHNTPFFKSKS